MKVGDLVIFNEKGTCMWWYKQDIERLPVKVFTVLKIGTGIAYKPIFLKEFTEYPISDGCLDLMALDIENKKDIPDAKKLLGL